jgi:hypothetical protein
MALKTAITFGLVHIPVTINPVIKNNDISFNYLHKKCLNRVNYIKYCLICKKNVKNTDLIKGYEYVDDKYVTFDNKTWVATSEYREGYQLNTDTIKTDEYLCDNGNKYEKLQIVFIDHPYISAINEYTTGDLIEENAVECQWITLTFDTDKTIPMQRFRIDATDPQTSGYYFIRFSSTPNGSFTNTRFSICPDEGIIFDDGTRKNITDQINIEGNIYEYTFSVPIYFADAEQNAPVSQVKYQPI